MMWLTWRQFRVQAVSVFAALAAICVVLAITGPEMVGETNFSDQEFLYFAGLFALYLLPAVIGVFWGVPMVTRELESGTHSLVWNQSIGRTRWLAVKLGVGAAAAMLTAGLLSVAVSWWASPIDAAAGDPRIGEFLPRISPAIFAVRGIVPIGYAAFAFVLGIAVGMLLRRTLPAMAVTLAVFTVVQVAVPLAVRPHVLPAVDEAVAITASNLMSMNGDGSNLPELVLVAEPAGAWVLVNETLAPDGEPVSRVPPELQGCMPTPPSPGGPPPKFEGVRECFLQLSELGYRQHLVYQPAGRFWPLQWIETGLFLALSALLTWFCFRRIRHLS
jgi:hypothetical protein